MATDADSKAAPGSTPSLGPDAIASLFQKEAKPVFFLGAGASIKSGIPLAGTFVTSIAKFAYCKAHNRDVQDPTVRPSDWLRWLEAHPWYRLDVPAANLYPLAVEHLLRPQSNRKEFFLRALRPDVPVSEGYRRLARLLSRRQVRTVLTTNFDDLVRREAQQLPGSSDIAAIATPSDYAMFRTTPPHPQVVFLHGSVAHYSDCNLIEETQTLQPGLADLLVPLLRDHPLVVIGYRGTEPSIMKDLLIGRAERCGGYREGIYWCHIAGSSPLDSPLVQELSATIGSNLQFIPIEGFDELLIALDRAGHPGGVSSTSSSQTVPRADVASRVNDLQPSSLQLADLNEPLLKAKLSEYAHAMRMSVPDLRTEDALVRAMLSQGLGVRQNSALFATKGGQLLFANGTAQQVEWASIAVTVSGPPAWVNAVLDIPQRAHTQAPVSETLRITGDLWSQLEQASNLLSRVNRPFRMKGPVSQTAYPYTPLALKELLTNLLAHRDYKDNRESTLTITREKIQFENPGGLVDSVRRQLEEESIQQVIGVGTRRLKGYRNPVVADFFFSAGAMDKEGSGLPDVVQEAANNLNTVTFGPSADNSSFLAIVQCRPESLRVDEETNTVRPEQGELRYSPNLLRIVDWPERIRKLATIATHKDVARVEVNAAFPLGLHKNWIWTFVDPTLPASSVLADLVISEEQHEVGMEELLQDRDAQAILPRLLNTALANHLRQTGLIVKFEPGRLRAYYPSDQGHPREISYRSTFRQSKRTVAKPISSRSTGKVVYWEHKAVSLRFERFDSTWALSLLPGYVFTLDGHSQPIASDRIGPLSTRRAARDYNPTVLHDLVFWSRMLSGQAESHFTVSLNSDPSPAVVNIEALVPSFVFQEAIETGVAQSREAEIDSDFDLQEEIEQAIAETSTLVDSANETPNR